MNRHPRGFAAVAEDYLNTYGLPAMLSETNIRGALHERIAWLKFMEAECEELLLAGRDLQRVLLVPFYRLDRLGQRMYQMHGNRRSARHLDARRATE